LRSLYQRLTLVLVAICVALGLLQVALALYLFQRYDQEATQKLNHQLAAHLVQQNLLGLHQTLDTSRLEALFDRQMRINPTIEIYLLDRSGEILACTAPLLRHLKRKKIDLRPVAEFLGGAPRFPLLGDDPRHVNGKKIFSAAAIPETGEPRSYLYVILSSTAYQSIWDMLRGSYVFQFSAALVAGALALTALTALLVFRFMTRPLEMLAAEMERFQASGFAAQAEPAVPQSMRRSDEIARLRRVYQEMAGQIALHIDQLKMRDSRRRELVAEIVHDLKAPVTVIRGYLDTLLLKIDNLDEAQRKSYLTTASANGQRLTRMLDDLLQLSKLETNEQLPCKESFSIVELVQDVAIKFHIDGEAKGVAISVNADPATPQVHADIGMIERVLENLVRNALAHTPRGGKLRLSVEPQGSRVRTEIADTGSGIAEEELPRIFDRFYRAERPQSNAGLHLGLGLAIVKRILELHDSKIKVESRTVQGSRFWFTLERADVSNKAMKT
jgi:two-component system, OmpR family, sensor kinase